MMFPRAITKLDAAITLHQKHMDGTEPTSDASQEKLMRLMEAARAALESGHEDMMTKDGRRVPKHMDTQ